MGLAAVSGPKVVTMKNCGTNVSGTSHNRRSGEATNQAGTGFQFSLRAIQATTAKPATSQTRQ